MPIIRSAKKALRQSVRRKVRNLQKKNRIKKLVKQVKGLVAEKKYKEAENLLPDVYQAFDKAAKTGVLKKNTAARKKSRIALFAHKSARTQVPQEAKPPTETQ